MKVPERNHYALLLSGGGARAAYQVGVLKAIAAMFPRNHTLPFPIICGNSAGAINATALACYASCYHLGVRKLEWIWKNFRTSQVYDSGLYAVFGYLLKNNLSRLQSGNGSKRATSLLNNAPLRHLIRRMLDFHRIDRNIISGHLRAISVSASSYSRHESISFFQGHNELLPWQREQRQGKRCVLGTEHLMASSAIPLVFPTVKIDHQYLGDGSVHQLSPLSTPIHLGAEKILVIGVEQPEKSNRFNDLLRYPSGADIAGHLLDTIFADTLHADLERLNRINTTLDLLNAKQKQDTKLKSVECMVINPSINFANNASKHYHRLPAGIKGLLRLIGVTSNSDTSLLSYLLFEKEFCQELIELGYQDGLNKRDELQAFLEI
jgi:NTE family protein